MSQQRLLKTSQHFKLISGKIKISKRTQGVYQNKQDCYKAKFLDLQTIALLRADFSRTHKIELGKEFRTYKSRLESRLLVISR